MDSKLFKVIYKASPEFREMMSFLSRISESQNKSLKEELELWSASTLPNVTEKRNQKNERKEK